MPYCLIFPGQGTQFPGMSVGLDLNWIGDDALISLMAEGPEDILTQTINAQKAVFAVTAALWDSCALNTPALVMGHSLGEYMALVASGTLSLQECYTLVSARASAMENAMAQGEGAMAAVLGLSADGVSETLETLDGVWVANINTNSQIVISGTASAIQKAAPLLKEKGAKKVIPLNVAVSSHCPLMDPARKSLREYLKSVRIQSPKTRMVFNAVAGEESAPEKIKDLLADQLVSPVQWEKSVRYAAAKGIDRFIEIGPKSVLAPMVRKIVPDARVEVITAYGH